jgi:hypothetical protein
MNNFDKTITRATYLNDATGVPDIIRVHADEFKELTTNRWDEQIVDSRFERWTRCSSSDEKREPITRLENIAEIATDVADDVVHMYLLDDNHRVYWQNDDYGNYKVVVYRYEAEYPEGERAFSKWQEFEYSKGFLSSVRHHGMYVYTYYPGSEISLKDEFLSGSICQNRSEFNIHRHNCNRRLGQSAHISLGYDLSGDTLALQSTSYPNLRRILDIKGMRDKLGDFDGEEIRLVDIFRGLFDQNMNRRYMPWEYLISTGPFMLALD